VSSDGTRIAVVSLPTVGEPWKLHIARLPDLSLVALVDLPAHSRAGMAPTAFDPTGTKLYLMIEGRLLVVDVERGTILREMVVSDGCGFCAANPVTVSRDGQFVIFETGEGALFVDTGVDLPLHRLTSLNPGRGSSVAASPTEDVVYVLESTGILRRVRIP
jgi:hypothetical protein